MTRVQLVLAALAAWVVGACAGGQPVTLVGGPKSLESLIPWHQQTMTVEEITQQHGFLLVDLGGSATSMQAYYLDNPQCRSVFKKGSQVTFQGTDRFGQASTASGVCLAIGTRELVAFRNTQYSTDPEGRVEGMTAVFKTLYADTGGEIWLRGQFPYAKQLGFMWDDLIMIVPASEACKKATAQGTALMYYNDSGARVFILTAGGARCSATGVIDPS